MGKFWFCVPGTLLHWIVIFQKIKFGYKICEKKEFRMIPQKCAVFQTTFCTFHFNFPSVYLLQTLFFFDFLFCSRFIPIFPLSFLYICWKFVDKNKIKEKNNNVIYIENFPSLENPILFLKIRKKRKNGKLTHIEFFSLFYFFLFCKIFFITWRCRNFGKILKIRTNDWLKLR